MPNPKRRHSRGRRDRRRATQALTHKQYVRCSNCGATIKPHHACQACGHYRGRQVDVGASA
ncbi:MAG: 50S ribosomal protein L32 [Planctomycetes bacterium]|nr:50S ribosomal protein L32 [Planctomycetota bacterium]